MRYFIISDIHGSLYYLQLALKKYNEHHFTHMIILGDILYHGPRNDLPKDYNPKEVCKLLNSYSDQIIAVKGNCDAEVDQMVLNFKIHNRKRIHYNGVELNLVHGHHIIDEPKNKIYLYGHTHINSFDGNYLNIGSLSIPKDGIYTYAILDKGLLKVYDLLTDKVINEYKIGGSNV